MSTRLVITGDSHCVALSQGRKRVEEKGGSLPRDCIVEGLGNGYYMNMPYSEKSNGCVRFTYEEYVRTFEKFGIGNIGERDDVIFGFSMSLNSPPAFRDPFWRGNAPWNLSIEKGLNPVFTDVLPSLFLPKWVHIQAFLKQCLDVGVPFFVISGPPPKRSHDCMRDGTDPDIVLEVNRLYRKVVESWLTKHNIQVVHTPPEVLDETGFLATNYYHPHPKDQHHANDLYGE
ncbi:hypothetical protein [Pararhodobacter sp.]|uniref:hypothetical protein n=1 Tax=Pararhodobacter sp. TaxID=2127056 RepID=UPI002AFF4AE8|nr:hypothetical protein [Pararhodobacter sp.]